MVNDVAGCMGQLDVGYILSYPHPQMVANAGILITKPILENTFHHK